jgi:hypothetical protein
LINLLKIIKNLNKKKKKNLLTSYRFGAGTDSFGDTGRSTIGF